MIDYRIFEDANIGIRSGTGNPAKRTSLNSSNSNSIAHENTHIAFGSRVRSGLHKSNNNNNNNEHTTNPSKSNLSTGGSKDTIGEPSLTSRGINILPSKPASRSVSKAESDVNNNEIVTPNNGVTTNMTFQPRPPDKNAKKSQNNIRRLRTVKSADVRSRSNSQTAALAKQQQQQVFSKSADSRNRRRPSITDDDKILPTIVKIKKGISRSAFDLEKSEKEISDNRDLHFKSKSLSVLPKICSGGSATRNNRYGKSISISQEEENEKEQNSEIRNEDDNVFVQEEEEEDKNEELMALADENDVDDYLKLRTRSSCREDESASYSSCNSANSDLFLYSSRPRSVIKHRTESQQKSKSRSRATSESKSRSNSRNNADNVNSTTRSSSNNNNNNNETYTVSPQADIAISKDITDNSKKEDVDEAIGVDLSWEYSESTSMLVIPKELKQDGEEAAKVPLSVMETTAEFFSEDVVKNSKVLPVEEQRSEQEFKVENGTSEATTTTTSSGIISDLSSNDQNNNSQLLVKDNNEKASSNLIHSSCVMRESCDSDSMSWLKESQDPSKLSVAMTSTLDKMKSPNVALRRRLLKEQLGSLIVQSKDVESESDGMSECSDDTTYTDLPPKRFRNYR